MQPTSPVIPGENFAEIVVAENQAEYLNLPVIDCGEGVILSRWRLSDEEGRIVAETGDVYLFMHTFGNPVTPVMLQVQKPEVCVETAFAQIANEAKSLEIVALRRTPERAAKIPQGATVYSKICKQCAAEIMVSLSSIEAARGGELSFICVECAQAAELQVCVLPETAAEFERLTKAK